MDLAEVSEALPFGGWARAPGSPPQFRGVMNLRGELRPVLDLAVLLSISENGDRDSGFVLMLRRPGREIGLKVDSIEELRELRPEELSVPAQGGHVKGIASGALMLLDVEAVLAAVFSKEESLGYEREHENRHPDPGWIWGAPVGVLRAFDHPLPP